MLLCLTLNHSHTEVKWCMKQIIGFPIVHRVLLSWCTGWMNLERVNFWQGDVKAKFLGQGYRSWSGFKIRPTNWPRTTATNKGKKCWTRHRRWVSCRPCGSAWWSSPIAPSWSRWSTPKIIYKNIILKIPNIDCQTEPNNAKMLNSNFQNDHVLVVSENRQWRLEIEGCWCFSNITTAKKYRNVDCGRLFSNEFVIF